ncbi:MAG: acetate--CoA ligase family protein [Hyphomicrobiales bacterium]
MTPKRRANLERLLSPRHVAFIGGRDALIAIGEAKRIGYRGKIWPVNPKRAEMGGFACYASVDDLPHAPDAVFLAVPVSAALDTVRALRDRGAGGIVCYTAGFGEAGDEGKAAEAALVEAAGDLAVIGPNCYGVINYRDRVALWPFAHGGSCPGYGAAIVTQSGMLSSDLTMSQRSAPFTHMISCGNQAVLTIEDLVEALVEKPDVRAIGLHIEGLKDVQRFAEIALEATTAGKPIVALKTGSSAIGQSLTVSHTGSLSGDDALYDALFDRAGVIRVHDPSTLIETLKFVCISGVPKGNRVAGFTCSGGGATMLADIGEGLGLAFPPPNDQTRSVLTGLLPAIATVSNPLDYTTPIWGQGDKTRPVFEAAIANGADVALLVQDYPAPGLDESQPFYQADGDAFADAVHKAVVPGAIVSTMHENFDQRTRDHFLARGIAPMQGLSEALGAVSGAVRWSAARDRIRHARPAKLIRVRSASAGGVLTEADGKALLRAAGVPVPEGRLAEGSCAATTAESLGFPVALKMMSPDLAHKTEAGAVALNLRSAGEVKAAVETMRARVAKVKPAAVTDRFLVERMQPAPLAELLVGIRRDAQFGLAMTLGSGGILVELVGDAATLLLPSTADDILRALDGLKVSRLLSGFRGRPAVDRPALAQALLSIAAFAQAHADEIAELEINPLFVYERSVCAVDALLRRAA